MIYKGVEMTEDLAGTSDYAVAFSMLRAKLLAFAGNNQDKIDLIVAAENIPSLEDLAV